MANVFIQDTTMTAIADAIRAKGGTEDSLLPSAMPDAISAIETGGGGGGGEPTDGDYLVQFIGYRGEVYQTGRYNTGDTVSVPADPSHDGLVFDGWSSPVTITDGTVTVGNSDLTIGAMFDTTSGATEIDITLTNVTGLDVTLQNITGVTLIEWGDGASDTEIGTHTYDNIGKYTILIYGNNINFGDTTGYIFNQSSSTYNQYCTEIRFGNIYSVGNYALRYCTSINSITLPITTASLGNYSFGFCYSLQTLVCPTLIISLGANMAQYCRVLNVVVLSNNVTSLNNSCFRYCYYLDKITMPAAITTIDSNALQGNYFLSKFKIPNTIDIINGGAFGGCENIVEYDFTDFTSTGTVPTLSNTTAFSSINAICKMYFRDQATLDNFANATNWSTYADYMYVKEVAE